jgi:5-methylcytosine-specific restriction endonuclease McrA
MRAEREHQYDLLRKARQPWRAWYKTVAWLAIRAKRLAEEPLCRRCKARGRLVLANTCDHVEPHRGNRDLFFNYSNTQSLCPLCHNSSKQSEERRGHAIGTGADGRPLDPSHPWNAR